LKLFFVDPAPPPTEDICTSFNELRSDMVLLCELRTALSTCVYEMESLKHQYEAACPGKVSLLTTVMTAQPMRLIGFPLIYADTEHTALAGAHQDRSPGQ